MVEQSDLIISVQGPVGTITLNRPSARNSMTPQMLEGIQTVVDAFNADESVRVIVVTGTGKFFCGGRDLLGLIDTSPQSRPHMVYEKLWTSNKPVVGAINGPAVGAGAGIMFAADIRVMCEGAFVSFPEVNMGILPAIVSGYVAPQLGPYLTQSLMLTGEQLSAERCLHHGLVSKVVAPDAMKSAVDYYVSLLLKSPKDAHAGVKRLVRLVNYCGEYHTEAMDGLVTEFKSMMQSSLFAYGRAAFKGKRPADWNEYYRRHTKSKL